MSNLIHKLKPLSKTIMLLTFFCSNVNGCLNYLSSACLIFFAQYFLDFRADEISGTDSDEALTGTVNADTISGLAGDDLINSEGGKDQAYGNSGERILIVGYHEVKRVFLSLAEIQNEDSYLIEINEFNGENFRLIAT